MAAVTFVLLKLLFWYILDISVTNCWENACARIVLCFGIWESLKQRALKYYRDQHFRTWRCFSDMLIS